MNLFRGSEYERYYNVTKRKALTFYDLGLSSQERILKSFQLWEEIIFHHFVSRMKYLSKF